MKAISVFGVLGATITGVLIGLQATLGNRSGALIGAGRTGLLMNVFGGGFALLIVLGLWIVRRETPFNAPPAAVNMLLAGGVLGIFIVMGVSASLQLSGVTAGIAALILGQMLIGTLVDAVGWGGAEPIPVSTARAAGLLVMALAVYLLLPKN
jgi:uncharacterized membrane protein YdcZ (DUF606 family)